MNLSTHFLLTKKIGLVFILCFLTLSSAMAQYVRVAASFPLGGRTYIKGVTSNRVVSTKPIEIVAIPYAGYSFKGWKNTNTQQIVSENSVYIVPKATSATLMALFQPLNYVAMQHTYTSATTQQNRYLKSVTTTNTNTPVVFVASRIDELPFTNFTSPNTYTSLGAVIDKTSEPIIVEGGVNSFTMTFKAWTESINGNASELSWTQQAAFIDWNADGVFAGENEILTRPTTNIPNETFVSTEGYTRTITIPENTPIGDYRMRVVYYEPTNHASDWAATLFDSATPQIRNGVAYDFVIRITNDIPALWKIALVDKLGTTTAENYSQDVDTLLFSTTDVKLKYHQGNTDTWNLATIDSVCFGKDERPLAPTISGVNNNTITPKTSNITLTTGDDAVVYWDATGKAVPDSLYSEPLALSNWIEGKKQFKAVAVKGGKLSPFANISFTLQNNQSVAPQVSTSSAPVWYKIMVAPTATNNRAGRILSHNTKYSYPTTTNNVLTVDTVLWRIEGTSLSQAKLANQKGEYLVCGATDAACYFRNTFAEGSTFAIEDNNSNSINTFRLKNGSNYLHPGVAGNPLGDWCVIGYDKELNTNSAWRFVPAYTHTINLKQGVPNGDYGINATGKYVIQLFEGGTAQLVANSLGGATFMGWSTDNGKTIIQNSNVASFTINIGALTANTSSTYTPVFDTKNLPPLPTISFSEVSTNSPYSRGYINLSTTVKNGKLEYQINSGEWKTYTQKINIKTLTSGRNSFNVRVTDPVTSYFRILNEYITYDGGDAQDATSWLDHVSNFVTLSKLNLPGSHETCATGGTIWHKCQNSSITEQLNAGVRVLDFRIGNDMQLFHGSTGMGIYATAAFTEVANFLTKHPSEFVIVSIKDENWSGTQADWTSKMQKIMDATGRAYVPGESRNYTVGELRGKFIILRRYGNFGGQRGINPAQWPNDWYTTSAMGTPPLHIQDAYNYSADLVSAAGSRKWGYAQKFFEKSFNSPNDGIVYFNYLNATSVSTPGAWANYMNPKMSDYIDSKGKGRYGIIMIDFVGSYVNLPSKIFKANKFKEL